MKLENRERVDGTQVTIGCRVYYRDGKTCVSKRFAAEYRDVDGVQQGRSLGTTNRARARRMAIEIQQEIEQGIEPVHDSTATVEKLADAYFSAVKAKGVAPKTVWKYRADLNKLKEFCREMKLCLARRFSETDLYRYREWLVGREYADKTVQGALVLAKQLFKWAWRQGMLRDYRLAAATFAKAKARPQPCFTSSQVNQLIGVAVGEEKSAFALMGYAGLRIGEVEQLRWQDIQARDGNPTMLHIRRGGSNGSTKDKDERFVPIHPKVAEQLGTQGTDRGPIYCGITQRALLKRLKVLCEQCEFEDPQQYKLHSFRHHFASLCANNRVAHRKALAWLGHSSSDMLDLYYHLHDEDSLQTMKALADSGTQDVGKELSEGNLRATGQSTIEKTPQAPEIQELVDALCGATERVGFEPTVPFGTLVFETSSFSRSDTSPDCRTFGPAEEFIGSSAMRQEGKLIGGEEPGPDAVVWAVQFGRAERDRSLRVVQDGQVSRWTGRNVRGVRADETMQFKRLRHGEDVKFFQLAMGVETIYNKEDKRFGEIRSRPVLPAALRV